VKSVKREGDDVRTGSFFARHAQNADNELTALETAATNSGVEIHDMPGNITGYRHFNRDVMRVLTAGDAMVKQFCCFFCGRWQHRRAFFV